PLNYWGPGFAVFEDGIVAVIQSTTGNLQRQSLVHAAGAGEPRELFAMSRELVRMDVSGISVPAPGGCAPDLLWTAGGAAVLVLNGAACRLGAYVDGRRVARLRRALEPIVVSAGLAAERVGAGPYRDFMRRAGITADQIVAAVGYEA